MKKLNIDTETGKLKELKNGTPLMITGTLHTARDAALKLLEEDGFPSFLKNSIIYHAGPTNPTKAGEFSCGPTTSSRMDKYLDFLYSNGLAGTIGKGAHEKAPHKKYKTVYLLAIGGCGALYGSCIKDMKPVLYPELGSEAIYRAYVEDFPVIVGVDSMGRDIFTNNRR